MAMTEASSDPSSLPPPSKRRRVGASKTTSDGAKTIDLTSDDSNPVSKLTVKAGKALPIANGSEKRLRRFRTHAPTSFQGRLERALSQRYDSPTSS